MGWQRRARTVLLQSFSKMSLSHTQLLVSARVRLLLPLVEIGRARAYSDGPTRESPGLVPLWRPWQRAVQRRDLKSPVVLEHVVKALGRRKVAGA